MVTARASSAFPPLALGFRGSWLPGFARFVTGVGLVLG